MPKKITYRLEVCGKNYPVSSRKELVDILANEEGVTFNTMWSYLLNYVTLEPLDSGEIQVTRKEKKTSLSELKVSEKYTYVLEDKNGSNLKEGNRMSILSEISARTGLGVNYLNSNLHKIAAVVKWGTHYTVRLKD